MNVPQLVFIGFLIGLWTGTIMTLVVGWIVGRRYSRHRP